MTPEQIEKAARHLCKLRGIDPDKTVWHGGRPGENGATYDIAMCSPAWGLVADEIKQNLQIQEAIAVATEPYADKAAMFAGDPRIRIDPVTGNVGIGEKK